MKILILSELFYPHGGGAELATSLYADILAKEGNDVKIVTNRFASEQEVTKKGNLVIYRVPLTEGEFNKFVLLFRNN